MSIEEHVFTDEDLSLRDVDDISLSLNVSLDNNNFDYIIFEIDDVIAMVKHFKLTIDDLG